LLDCALFWQQSGHGRRGLCFLTYQSGAWGLRIRIQAIPKLEVKLNLMRETGENPSALLCFPQRFASRPPLPSSPYDKKDEVCLG
jgi:hypothetical protein